MSKRNRTVASGQSKQIDNTDKVHRDLADYKLAAGAEAQLADEWKARADALAEALRELLAAVDNWFSAEDGTGLRLRAAELQAHEALRGEAAEKRNPIEKLDREAEAGFG